MDAVVPGVFQIYEAIQQARAEKGIVDSPHAEEEVQEVAAPAQPAPAHQKGTSHYCGHICLQAIGCCKMREYLAFDGRKKRRSLRGVSFFCVWCEHRHVGRHGRLDQALHSSRRYRRSVLGTERRAGYSTGSDT